MLVEPRGETRRKDLNLVFINSNILSQRLSCALTKDRSRLMLFWWLLPQMNMDPNFYRVVFLLLVTSAVFARGGRRVPRDVDPTIMVETSQGYVEGLKHEIGDVTLGVFLGIPYAKPPVGDLRFAPPQKADSWPGLIKTNSHPARCLHRPIGSDPTLDGVPEQEDCLYLDIYTTAARVENSLLPTMVFLHGGGFYGGSGALYDFKNLAIKGVVVVSVNFRLDAFGFLSTEGDVIPGNFGLMDAAFAVDWVKTNIPSFGGNSFDITLFGGSSGAAMVSAMMLSPLSQDSFNKAILQSGVSLAHWAVNNPFNNVIRPRRLAGELGDKLNCRFDKGAIWNREYDHQKLLECLRNVTAEELLSASIEMAEQTYKQYTGGMIWTMVVEKTLGTYPDLPEVLLKNRQDQIPKPVMYGYTAQDGSWLVPWSTNVTLDVFMATLRTAVEAWYSPVYQDYVFLNVVDEYLPEDQRNSKTPEELRDILVEALTDASMTAPIVQEALMYGGSGEFSQTYMYEFNYKPSYQAALPEWYGVGHGAEKGFVQGLPEGTAGYSYPNTTDADRQVADHVTTMWSNFAKYGNPTPTSQGGVSWPLFHDGNQVLVIQENLEVKKFTGEERVKVWIEITEPKANGAPSLSCPLASMTIALVIGLQLVAKQLTKE